MGIGLRDQIWSFFDVLVGIVALVAMLALPWTQRRRKSLAYEVVANTPLLNRRADLDGPLEVRYDRRLVSSPRLLVLKVVNDGNTPIVAADFARPLTITCDGAVEVLAARVASSQPANLGASVDVDANAITLAPLLLNRGDSVVVQAVTDSPGAEVLVDARVVGVANLREVEPPRYQRVLPAGYVAAMSILLAEIAVMIVAAADPGAEARTVVSRLIQVFSVSSVIAVCFGIRSVIRDHRRRGSD